MAIRADSYGSTSEVKAFTRHLLDGQSAFNSTTRPTATELERFIDRASGVLNLALEKVGLTTPVTNTTAALVCADWVTNQAVMYVEVTQRGTGYGDGEGSRTAYFKGLYGDADTFAGRYALGFKRLGVGVSHPSREGLAFTGMDAPANRADPEDSGVVQPHFRRGQFDAPNLSTPTRNINVDDW